MGILHRIWDSLRGPSAERVAVSKAESEVRWQKLQEDIGPFVYEEDGFSYPFDSGVSKICWSDIDRIVGYKLDMMTTDEICIEIHCNGRRWQFSESLAGWYQLLDRIKMVFPAIPDGWDWDVAMPPFATNYTVLYEREARGLPGRYNFYASLERADPAAVAAAFENQGWAMRKSGGEEMEANLSWGEISIVKDKQEVLLNGRVDFRPDHVEDLHHLLDGIAGVYQYEFYDEEGRVLLERRRPG